MSLKGDRLRRTEAFSVTPLRRLLSPEAVAQTGGLRLFGRLRRAPIFRTMPMNEGVMSQLTRDIALWY
jgi:hypothetical protein